MGKQRSTIPLSVLCGVRHGDLGAIQTLADTMTRENYSPSVTEAILLNFRLTDLRAVPEEGERNAAYVTMASMACLAGVPGVCDRTPELRKATIKTLLAHLDEILLCLIYTVNLPTVLFQSLVDLDRDLSMFIFASETALDVLFSLWVGQKKDFDPTFKFFNAYDGKVYLSPHVIVCHGRGRAAAPYTIHLATPSQVRFNPGHGFPPRPTGFVFREYQALTRTLLRVTEHPTLEARMRKKGYLKQWSAVCLDLGTKMKKEQMYYFLEPLYAQAVENPAIMVDVINYGVARLLFQLVTQREKPTPVEPPEWVGTVIATLRAFSFLHRTIEALAPLAKDFPSECMARAGRSPALVKAWTSLWGGGLFRAHVYDLVKTGGIGSSIVCDNHLHDEEPIRWVMKACAGCHSVVYCSIECRKEDWETVHHRECRDMYRTYLDRKFNDLRYSFDARLFHTELSVMVYGKCYEQHAQHLVHTHGDPSVCERFMLIYHSDGPTGQPYTAMIPVKDSLTYANENERWQADCTFIAWGSNHRIVVILEMDQGRKIQEVLGKTYQTVLRSSR
ncbi:hypothetical protein BKA70DRAFT_1309012 [Coprinopsis sp. MPI-PUGE-AT-0042]|nr:hypothetical protein BKA70DRAFT_1309012 [Coprinopsis sp. MPI-PUGE-AT-0042]